MALKDNPQLPQDPVRRPVGAIDRQILGILLETKAVNFEALGTAIAQFGPKSVFEDDG